MLVASTAFWTPPTSTMRKPPMPEVIEITVYKFDELTERAQAHARDWYREASAHDEWWYHVYADFEAVYACLGIDIKRVPARAQKPTGA